jgi:hypothetical protein
MHDLNKGLIKVSQFLSETFFDMVNISEVLEKTVSDYMQ